MNPTAPCNWQYRALNCPGSQCEVAYDGLLCSFATLFKTKGNFMSFSRRQLLAIGSATMLLPTGLIRAQQAGSETVRLGMLTDMSGPFRDVTGPTGVICAKQAVAEFTAEHSEIKVEVLVADHQNKPD